MSQSADTTSHPSMQVTPPSHWDTKSAWSLLNVIREDIRANSGGLLVPAIQMLVVHRLGEWAAVQPSALRAAGMLVFRIFNVYVRNVLGFEVSHLTKIGRRVVFVHQNGVVLQPNAEIGDECMIYHNVTVGRRWDDGRPESFRDPVRIGKGVHLGVGSTIIGAVQIGDGAKIGPHAVVTTSVPAGASVIAPMSRTMRLR
jgi:serine O-acetyltransferase